MRFIHALFALSLAGAANPVAAEQEASWPTEISACEAYLGYNCHYLLCLCYVGTNPGEKENKLGVDLKAVSQCQRQYDLCQRENSMPDAQYENESSY